MTAPTSKVTEARDELVAAEESGDQERLAAASRHALAVLIEHSDSQDEPATA